MITGECTAGGKDEVVAHSIRFRYATCTLPVEQVVFLGGIPWKLPWDPSRSGKNITGYRGIPPLHPTASRGAFRGTPWDTAGHRGTSGEIALVPVGSRRVPRIRACSHLVSYGSRGISLQGTTVRVLLEEIP